MNNYGLPTEGTFLLIFFLLAVFVAIVVGIVTYRKEKNNNKIEKCEASKEEKLTLDAKTIAILTYLKKLGEISWPSGQWPWRESQRKVALLDQETTVSFLDYVREKEGEKLLPDYILQRRISIERSETRERLKVLLSERGPINKKIMDLKSDRSSRIDYRHLFPPPETSVYWEDFHKQHAVAGPNFGSLPGDLRKLNEEIKSLSRSLMIMNYSDIPTKYQEFFSKYFPKADNYNITGCIEILSSMITIVEKARVELTKGWAYGQTNPENQSLLNIRKTCMDLQNELQNILSKKSAATHYYELISQPVALSPAP